jgi:hypothetical protein
MTWLSPFGEPLQFIPETSLSNISKKGTPTRRRNSQIYYRPHQVRFRHWPTLS